MNKLWLPLFASSVLVLSACFSDPLVDRIESEICDLYPAQLDCNVFTWFVGGLNR